MGHCCSVCVRAGAFYGTWNCECVFFRAGNRTNQSDDWILYGEERCLVGADGIIVEVHNNPECALCDGAQSLKPKKFAKMMDDLRQIAPIVGKTMK